MVLIRYVIKFFGIVLVGCYLGFLFLCVSRLELVLDVILYKLFLVWKFLGGVLDIFLVEKGLIV